MENRLRVWRAERGVTQLDLALEVGVSDTQLSLIERGRVEPTDDLISALAKALKTTPAELFPTLAEQRAEVR